MLALRNSDQHQIEFLVAMLVRYAGIWRRDGGAESA